MTNNLNDFLNKILLGDSLEYLRQLPSNSIDAVITDPPYCSGGRTASEKALPPSKKYEQGSNTIVHRPDFVGDIDILPMPKGRGFLDTNDICLLK